EWLGAQQEYLAVRATGDAALAQAARQRLLWLGMPAALVEQVDKTGRAQALQTLTAPTSGVITELALRAGMTLAPGMTLARINGLSTVWLEAALPEAQAALFAGGVRPGQPVQARFAALPGEVVNGRVTAVLPEADRETRTLRLRIELPNPARRLTAGLYAQVSLQGPQREVLVVPAEGVIRTGRRALVYVADAGGRYRPVEVQLGEQIGDNLVVRSGLAEGQQVVVSGQFLLDSEASLQGLLARGASSAPAAVVSYRTRGVVVAVEADGLTLKHEAIAALKWPPMTMPFQLADPGLARGLAPGQAVEFTFIQRGDEHVVTTIAPAGGSAR
ncbi:MAG: efflux RND transporter periplasmic adaptor subunit, partial [Burkholderiales bacterium]